MDINLNKTPLKMCFCRIIFGLLIYAENVLLNTDLESFSTVNCRFVAEETNISSDLARLSRSRDGRIVVLFYNRVGCKTAKISESEFHKLKNENVLIISLCRIIPN